MAQIRAELRITGRVQGVWFRQSTKQAADQFGVYGWVRNCTDGSVAAVIEGEEPAVRKLVDWCKTGPQLAQVETLQTTWKEATGEFISFNVR